MDIEELLWDLLINAYDGNMRSNIPAYVKAGAEPDDNVIQELVDCITKYIDKVNGMLGIAISDNLQKGIRYISAAEFKEPQNLKQKLSHNIDILSGSHNGYLFAVAILAIILNWKDLFYACVQQLKFNAQDEFRLDISKEDIKDCVKCLMDRG